MSSIMQRGEFMDRMTVYENKATSLYAGNVTGNTDINCVSPNDNTNSFNGNCWNMNVTCSSGDCSLECGDNGNSDSCSLMDIDATLSTNYQCNGDSCNQT